MKKDIKNFYHNNTSQQNDSYNDFIEMIADIIVNYINNAEKNNKI